MFCWPDSNARTSVHNCSLMWPTYRNDSQVVFEVFVVVLAVVDDHGDALVSWLTAATHTQDTWGNDHTSACTCKLKFTTYVHVRTLNNDIWIRGYLGNEHLWLKYKPSGPTGYIRFDVKRVHQCAHLQSTGTCTCSQSDKWGWMNAYEACEF